MDEKEKLHPSLEEQIRQAERIRDKQNDLDNPPSEDDGEELCIER